MKRAVITGATGAIGRALVSVCIQNGYEVIAVLHRKTQRGNELKEMDHCQVMYLNLDEYDRAEEEIILQQIETEGCELFFHLAWQGAFGAGRNDPDLQLSNVRASVHAVRFAKQLGCSAFLGTGSQAEYGRTREILSPSTLTSPETGYGIAKLCTGQMTRLICEEEGIRHIWCRVLSVYGPYDRNQTLISTAIDRMLSNEETSFTPCEQLWDYLYSNDAARAILLAAEKGNSGEIYVIGSGQSFPLRQYILDIADATGYKKEIGFGKREYNDRQVMFLQADISSLKEQFGFQPEVTFQEGIRRIIQWKKTSGQR